MKILILPSTTGQGDLAVASVVASALQSSFDVSTAYYAENSESPLLSAIPGRHVRFIPESHPDHSGCYATQIRSLSDQITGHAPDMVLALNEPTFAIAGFIAGVPVLQATHFLDAACLDSGRKGLSETLRIEAFSTMRNEIQFKHLVESPEAKLFSILRRMHGSRPFPKVRRAFRKFQSVAGFRRATRLRAELLHKYGRVLATNYLSLLLSDELVVHSIFLHDTQALKRLNLHRRQCGKPPAVVASSLPVSTSARIAPSLLPPLNLLVTFGGINHSVTPGLERLLRVLDRATCNFDSGLLDVVLAGRVTDTKRQFFEHVLASNPHFQRGGIRIAGCVRHEEHLKLISDAHIVMAQPGYSTLCEMAAAKKPLILFYGLAAYYEQFANFMAANNSGLCIRPGRVPWLQVGEYKTFGSSHPVSEDVLAGQLRYVIAKRIDGLSSGGSMTFPNRSKYWFVEALLLAAEKRAQKGIDSAEPVQVAM